MTKTTFSLIGCTFLLGLTMSSAQTNLTNYGTNSGESGNNNSFFGANTGRNNTSGTSNNFFGLNAGQFNTEGNNNILLGTNAGRENITGNSNINIGSNAGRTNLGSRNIYLGTNAGRENTNGSGNVFIGHRVGYNATGNNLLYIDNSDTDIPLLYGKFSTDQLGINTNTIPNDITLAVGGNTLIDGSIVSNGKISIGTSVAEPDYSLTVKGKIHVQEVKVDLLGAIAPDYVFYKDYELKTLDQVQEFISKNGHLPNVPSAKEMELHGVNLKEMNLTLLEKIEELTLYIIDQNKNLENQKKKNEYLSKRLDQIEALLEKQN